MTEKAGKKQENSRLPNGQFAPGVSGNPKGKEKGTRSLTSLVRDALKKCNASSSTPYEELLTQRIIKKAIDEGDMQAIKLIWNYLDGMPKQKLIGDSDQPIVVQLSGAGAAKYGIGVTQPTDETA